MGLFDVYCMNIINIETFFFFCLDKDELDILPSYFIISYNLTIIFVFLLGHVSF